MQRARQAASAPAAPAAEQWLRITERGRVLRVPVREVLYFKSELKYITVRTATASYLLDGSLGQLEAQYGEQFLRIHRNALVARHAMRELVRSSPLAEVDGWAVRLHGLPDEELPVSRRQLAKVRAAISAPESPR